MRIYQRGRNYWIDFQVDGVRTRKSLGPDERLAEIRAGEIRAEVERGKAGLGATPILSVRRRLDEYLRRVRATVSPKTAESYEGRRNTLVAFFEDRNISEGLVEDFTASRKEEGRKDNTVNAELSLLADAFADAPDKVKIRRLKVRDAKDVRFLSVEEVAALLQATRRPEDRELWVGYLYTGARRNELLSTTWESWKGGKLRLPNIKTTKAGPKDRYRYIRVVPGRALEAALVRRSRDREAYPSPFPCDLRRAALNSILRRLQTAARHAGIGHITIHTLRHTFASRLVAKGVPLYTVGKLLGHSTEEVTRLYAHLAPETLDAALDHIDY